MVPSVEEKEKKSHWKFWLALACVIIGATGFTVCTVIDPEWEGIPDILPIAFLVVGGGGLLALLIMLMQVLAVKEFEKKKGKLDRIPVSSIENVDMASVKKQVAEQFEQTEQGYFVKKKFSFARDKMTYIVKFASVAENDNFSDVVDKEFEKFDETPDLVKGHGAFCALFFMEKEHVCDGDKAGLRATVSAFMALESTVPSGMKVFALPFLYESETKTLWYFADGKKHIGSLYRQGMKLLERLTGLVQ